MKRVFVVRLALAVTVLLTASVASASVNWTRAAVDGAGDWNDSLNWDALPAIDTDYTYAAGAAELSAIEVTGSQTYGLRLVHGSTAVGTESALLTIKNGGSLYQDSVSIGSHSYVGRSNNAKMVIEAGGTFSTNAKIYIGVYTGSVGTVDVYGILDLSQERGNLLLGESATTGKGYLNILNGGVVKLSTFSDTFKGMQYKSFGAGSKINITGSGVMVHAGNSLTAAQEAITYGQIYGEGVVNNVVAAYDETLGVTTITAVPVADILLDVNVGEDQSYTRGLALMSLEATVVDDGNPGAAILTWSQTNGPGVATFANSNSTSTVVDFDAGGVYTLRLTADNTAGGGSEIVYDELEVTANNPTCQDIIGHNQLLAGDVTGDCYVNLADVAEIMADWLKCNNPQDASCDWAWE